MPAVAFLARHAPHHRADLTWMLGMLADSAHAYGDEFPEVREAVRAQLPVLRALLADDDPEAREAAAYAATHAVSDPEPLWARWQTETETPVRASLALTLGQLLRDRLGDRWNRLAAARALVRLGVPVGDLTEALVRGVADYGGRFGLATIRELQAVDTIPALESLATSDERLPVTAFADALVWTDEALVEGIRATIADLRAAAPGQGHLGDRP